MGRNDTHSLKYRYTDNYCPQKSIKFGAYLPVVVLVLTQVKLLFTDAGLKPVQQGDERVAEYMHTGVPQLIFSKGTLKLELVKRL